MNDKEKLADKTKIIQEIMDLLDKENRERIKVMTHEEKMLIYNIRAIVLKWYDE